MARPSAPTFWLLDGRTGWRTAATERIDGAGRTLRLAPEPDGPRGLRSPDGRVGGLADAPGTATGPDGATYRVVGGEVRRTDPLTGLENAVPGVGAGASGVRRVGAPTAIAAGADLLYVADPDGRVLAFVVATGVLRAVWAVADPADLAGDPDGAWILDRAAGRVLRHDARTDDLAVVVDEPAATGRWARVLALGADAVGLLDDAVPRVEIVRGGRWSGEVTDPAALTGAAGPSRPGAHPRTGWWESRPLDSRIPRCTWYRVRLELDPLPDGTAVRVATRTADGSDGEEDWTVAGTVTGPPGPRPAVPRPVSAEVLVRSGPGRELAVRLELLGGGDATPVVQAVRVDYPHASWREYLPAVFSEPENGAGLLTRFLAVFESEWDALERRLADVRGLFDPRAVPGPWIDWLSGVLGLAPERGRDDAARRRLLTAWAGVLGRHGRPDAVRAVARAALEAVLGRDLPDDGYPVIVEGFHERRRAVVGDPAPGPLGGASVVGRLRLGGPLPLGEGRLVSVGDPALDAFAVTAHRFTVAVPAAWLRTEEDAALVRRSIDAVKPASTHARLRLVEPGVRVGIQSTVGVDTLLGGPGQARLGGADEPGSALGGGTVLAHRAGAPTTAAVGTRIGEGVIA